MDAKEIIRESKVAIQSMKNHVIKNRYKEITLFKVVIEKMHSARSKNQLLRAYFDYIKLCIEQKYEEHYIYAGIVQNEEKNKEFGIDLELALKMILCLKYDSEKNNPKDIKKHADYMKHNIQQDFIPITIITDDSYREYAPVANAMKNAKTCKELSIAYSKYITLCLYRKGWDDYNIIAGIMANEEKNKEFNVDIEALIISYLIQCKHSAIDLPRYNAYMKTNQYFLAFPEKKALEYATIKETCIEIIDLGEKCEGLFENEFHDTPTDQIDIDQKNKKREIKRGITMNKKVKFSIINCEGCGLCYAQYPDYFTETEDGKAKVKQDIYDLCDEITKISKLCPNNAINLVEQKAFTKQEFVTELEKIKNYVVRHIKNDSVRFNEKEYSIAIPVASGERRYDYSSEKSAERAALQEFNNKMYSQMDVIILKIITEYRVKVIRPFYTKDSDAFFTKINNELSAMLSKMESILRANGLDGDIPSGFSEINIFPETDMFWKMLNKGELVADELISTVRSEFYDNSYRNLEDYNYWETDYMERPDGTDWRGNIKFKEKYCYRDIRNAFKEFAKDLMFAFHIVDNKIEDRALEIVNPLIDEYNKLLSNLLVSKIEYLEKKIKSFPNVKSPVSLDEYDDEVREVWKSDDGFFVNGKPIEDLGAAEVFVTKFDETQYFYDGIQLKKRYIKDGIIHSDVLFQNRTFEYRNVIGCNGFILFVDVSGNNDLYIYDTKNNELKKIDTKVLFNRSKLYNDVYVYSMTYNLNDIRYASGSIVCCKLDGSKKVNLLNKSGEGWITIDEVTEKKIVYHTFQESKPKTIEWDSETMSSNLFGSLFGGSMTI